jgi:DNA-binding NtrC family response regulator
VPLHARLRLRLWNNVFTPTSVFTRIFCGIDGGFFNLLLGKTGTGKGAAAAAVGRSGTSPSMNDAPFAESFTRSFIALNLSQFPATLIESELFGHEKGAFTGAIQAYAGCIPALQPARSHLSRRDRRSFIPVQIKLLQVLQERVFAPVGSHAKLRFSAGHRRDQPPAGRTAPPRRVP